MSWDKIENHLFDKYCVEGEDKELCNLMAEHDAEIRAKAIDEFAERLKKKYENCVVNDILMNNDVMSYTNSCNVFENFIDEIAEEMRGAK